ncbi:Protein N-acetyltransferase, RimJ/RimL family [Halobacillus alkaliphilus]|uniref:Protein N-acetyltransferase, RimJ/RimL family n=1 Tax=Halobacillus alkaliphilus TaxID=396056 RepID=A0A1I2JTW8_9BACI|nr:GNAT family N-acetyltransferase [Halobacillus alkaliphilus]SFF58024.1 Protein N-acetyltransferase, RimJ/RimL family [Halobacillus alkaliphilus]
MESKTLNSSISLVEYNDTYKNQLSNYYLPEEQLNFTSLPLEKIHNPSVTKNSTHVLILDNNAPVGYFALEDGEKVKRYSDNPKARVLTSFSINSKYQGNGLAKEGLRLLPNFVRESLPNIDEVVLGVNKRNHAAINLYLKTGFVDEKHIYDGAKGPQHVLHLHI